MPITDRVVVYGCGDEVICYAFNFRDSARTCLTAETQTAAFFGEAVTAEQREAMRVALDDLADFLRVRGACAGDVRLADATNPGFLLTF
jgi:DNA/RNA-binding domain of Phe-tRNA-synthetase-like protein